MSGLASFAVHSDRIQARQHAQEIDAARDPFDVDRQRILSCTAFRRLQFKAQVFTDQRHDHFRTRLSHTLEVADIARRIATALRANERLAECIALAHDLGHPPFGHAGERGLEAVMVHHGGFEHNTRSLRVVEYLEHPYPPFRGLNLTQEVREGLVTHQTRYDQPMKGDAPDGDSPDTAFGCGQPSVESQIVSFADRIAYDSHDIEDALGAELIDEDALKGVSLWRMSADAWRRAHPTAPIGAIRRPVLDQLIAAMIGDVVDEFRSRLARHGSVVKDQEAALPVMGFSDRIGEFVIELETFLSEHVYRHPIVARADKDAECVVRRVFEWYVNEPDRLPKRFARRIPDQGAHRVVCDYVAGMTDRFCRDELARIEPG